MILQHPKIKKRDKCRASERRIVANVRFRSAASSLDLGDAQ
jgi:hypothetical protein